MIALLGSLLAWAFPAIQWYAFRHIHGHIYDANGRLYMGRWWVVAPGTWQSRVLLFVTGGRYESIRLHHINRPDNDRDLHNHPFYYLTFVLLGYYSEFRCDRKGAPDYWQLLTRGKSSTGGEELWHRIDDVSPQGVWTFFMMGPNKGEWGFDTPDGYVESRAYFNQRGSDA